MKTKKENNIPENAKKGIRKKEGGYIQHRGGGKKVKYSKTTFALVYQGYDMLENLIVVRQYIQRRYDIDISLLKYYFLSPKQYYPRRFCSNGKRGLTMAG
jgi:hypothetical protein